MKYVRNTQIVWTRAFLRSLLEAQTDAEGAEALLVGLKHKFYTNPVNPTPDSVLLDFDLAALGTAGTDIEFSAVTNNPGSRQGVKAQIELVAGAEPTDETIEGGLILNTAMSTVLGAYRFLENVGIAIEGDGISVDLTVALPHTWLTGQA